MSQQELYQPITKEISDQRRRLAPKYVEAFAGGDIQTNPDAANQTVEKSSKTFTRRIDQMPSADILREIDRMVDMAALEMQLMKEGIKKFIEPQTALLRLVAKTRASLLDASRGRKPIESGRN